MNGNVRYLELETQLGERRGTRGSVDHGGGGGNNGDMEARLGKLEEFALEARSRLDRIETKLDHVATKHDLAMTTADLNKSTNDLIKWVVGTAIALGAVSISVMTIVLNNAVSKPAPATAQSPVIVNVPPPMWQSAPEAPATKK